ncbi:uncharacterized protein L203_105952 [Cryptococcus depauperatus CBS 7841]|uniref:Uncharacterized protein n=1 Tax=Cryptococcus depauperatus CBS 7841 TaxID=1295531 RepID=A0AAJ8JYE1_9TREE
MSDRSSFLKIVCSPDDQPGSGPSNQTDAKSSSSRTQADHSQYTSAASNPRDTNAAPQSTYALSASTGALATTAVGGSNDPSTGTWYGARGSCASMSNASGQRPAGDSSEEDIVVDGNIRYKKKLGKLIFDGFVEERK